MRQRVDELVKEGNKILNDIDARLGYSAPLPSRPDYVPVEEVFEELFSPDSSK